MKELKICFAQFEYRLITEKIRLLYDYLYIRQQNRANSVSNV
jgi:hypothetical protein